METNNKLREALTKILNLTNSLDEDCAVDPVEIRDIARAALAAPARNCDIGTIWEQDERFSAFCNRSFSEAGLCDKACPCRDFNMIGGTCSIVWGQMPHESEVEK